MALICIWTETPDGQWTACGANLYEFTVGGPADNQYRHCPYCGRHILARPLCQRCGGDGFLLEVVGVEPHSGAPIEIERPCPACSHRRTQTPPTPAGE